MAIFAVNKCEHKCVRGLMMSMRCFMAPKAKANNILELAMDLNSDAVPPFLSASDMNQANPHLIILHRIYKTHQQRKRQTKFQPCEPHHELFVFMHG